MANRIQQRTYRQAVKFQAVQDHLNKEIAENTRQAKEIGELRGALDFATARAVGLEAELEITRGKLDELTREHTGKISIDEKGAHFEIDGKPVGEPV